ncbi:MAG: dTMP kinase [Clostridia bacterium]|nr:dTMP kinase [Clostridia bacterium]
MKGKFITLEGCEGVGKSTQLKLLIEYLKENNIDFVCTREPGGTAISEKIRGIILDKDNTEMSAECEALLYASSRAQLLQEVIIPNLEQGKLVICDRYYDSSFAYQAYARGLGLEFVKSINTFALAHGVPDLTLFLDLTPTEAFKRKGGADLNDRIEAIGIDFHNKVYNGYKQMQELEPNRIISVDCSKEKANTHKNIINILKEKGIL